MGLIIKQGIKELQQDDKWQVYEDNSVQLMITGLEPHKTFADSLKITLKILSGKFKDKTVWDSVSYSGEHVWKYKALRKSAGVPFSATESEALDIYKLLMNKVVTADLTKRVDKEGNEWQNIKYKPFDGKAMQPNNDAVSFNTGTTDPSGAPEPTPPVEDIDANWNNFM